MTVLLLVVAILALAIGILIGVRLAYHFIFWNSGAKQPGTVEYLLKTPPNEQLAAMRPDMPWKGITIEEQIARMKETSMNDRGAPRWRDWQTKREPPDHSAPFIQGRKPRCDFCGDNLVAADGFHYFEDPEGIEGTQKIRCADA